MPIKTQASAPYRRLFGLTDDENGYVNPNVDWDALAQELQNAAERWYGEANSLGREAAPIIAQGIQHLLAGVYVE